MSSCKLNTDYLIGTEVSGQFLFQRNIQFTSDKKYIQLKKLNTPTSTGSGDYEVECEMDIHNQVIALKATPGNNLVFTTAAPAGSVAGEFRFKTSENPKIKIGSFQGVISFIGEEDIRIGRANIVFALENGLNIGYQIIEGKSYVVVYPWIS